MKALKAFRGYLARNVNWLLALLMVMVWIQPRSSVVNQRLVITFGTPEAYAAGTADYSLGTNGATNAANISTAIASLPAQGGLLHFKIGSYNISATVNLTGNVTIEGEGRGTYFFRNGSANIFTATGNNVIIRDCSVDSNTSISMGATTGWRWVNVYDQQTLWSWRDNGSGQSVFGTANVTQLNATTGNITTLNAPTGRGATYVIAASDTPPVAKAQADYVATGNLDTTISPLLANNVSILLLQGNYTTATINLSTFNNIAIGGVSKSSVKITLASGVNSNMFISGDNTTYTPNVLFHDFTLLGNSAGNPSAGYGIRFAGVENPWVNNVEIRDFTTNAVMFQGSTAHTNYPRVANSYIVENDANGVYFDINSFGGVVSSCTLAGNGKGTTNGAGVIIVSTSEHVITGNIFDANANGVTMAGASTITVTGNYFISQERAGVTCGSATTDLNISNNIFSACSINQTGAFDAIKIDSVRSVICNNQISNLGTTNKLNFGIEEITTAANNTITGNDISGVFTGHVVIKTTNNGSIIRSNIGYITENSGNVTLAANTSIVSVTHGLATTPTWVGLTSTSNTTQWLFVSGVSATTFNITSAVNVTANQTIYWRAVVGAGN